MSYLYLACVASVSVGLSAGLKHFSFLNARKLGPAKKSALLPSVLRSPQFSRAKKRKCLEWAEKPTETLAT